MAVCQRAQPAEYCLGGVFGARSFRCIPARRNRLKLRRRTSHRFWIVNPQVPSMHVHNACGVGTRSRELLLAKQPENLWQIRGRISGKPVLLDQQ
jgi:hypothetical protein